MATSLAKILKQLGKTWKETDAAELGGGGVSLPDSNYSVILQPARVELSKASDRLQVAWPMKVAQGKQKGKTTTKFDGLDNEVSISYVKAVMEALGIDVPKSAEKLPAAFDEFFEDEYKDRPVAVTVKSDGEFTNIYINGYSDEELDEDEGKKGKKDKKDKKEEKTYDGPSVKKVKKMDKKELKKLIKEEDMDTDPADYDDTDELRDAVVDEIEEMD